MQKDSNNAPIPAKRINKESASPNMEINRADVDTKQLCYGTRVSVMTKDGKKVKGTVRWAGELPLEGEDPKMKIPVYGLEMSDVYINYEHIMPVVVLQGRPQLGVGRGHGKVFIPQAMVEQDEQINDSDNTERNTFGIKDIHKEATVDSKGQAASKREKEKAALAKDLGPEIAKETNIEQQMKIMEELQKSKQCEDNAAVQAVGSSADGLYPAFQQNYPQSSSQLGRQSSYTQDPHQGSHQPSVVVPAQGDWAAQQHVGTGSAVIVSNSNPPIYGTIRWIGTIPGVNGHVAGVELEEPMDGCTDGVCLLNGVRYFDCPPNKGYFCLLEQLAPDDRFTARSKDFNNPMDSVPEEVTRDLVADSSFYGKYIGDQRGIQGHQNSCYLDATLFGLFALSSCFDELFLHRADTKSNEMIKSIIWKKIVNPLRSVGAARYESVMALRERLDDLGKMKGITKDEKDPEEFLNMLFKHVLSPEPFIQIRRPFGVEGEFFVQLFLESEANSDAIPTISDMLHRMFTEQDLSFTKAPQKLLIQVPRFGKQFKTYKRVIPNKKLNVSKLVHSDDDGFCFCCGSPAEWKCKECANDPIFVDHTTDTRICNICSVKRHKNTKYKVHNPVALPKREDMELDLLSVICIETSYYVCFSRADDRWLFFDSMANRIGDMYNIPRCTDCTREINGWVYVHPEKLLSTDPKPELVQRFTQDVYMCVYVAQDVGMY